MRIITTACPNCSTVVAANELEKRRVMKCPGLDCNQVLYFEDLDESERKYFLDHRNRYQM